MSNKSQSLPMSGGTFHTTRWSLVISAKGDAPEAKSAMGDLCEAYWMPVCRFLQREGRSEDESRELTQEFIAGLISKSSIDQLDPTKGRFRSYLLGALKHFLANKRRTENTQKRGGDSVIESIEIGGSETSPGLQIGDDTTLVTDAYFDRHWALAVMERGLCTVQKSFEESGKLKYFEVLKPWLMGDADGLSQSDAASELGQTSGATKVAIHRMRQKFGDAIRQEIAETVDSEEEIQEELRYLIEALQAR